MFFPKPSRFGNRHFTMVSDGIEKAWNANKNTNLMYPMCRVNSLPESSTPDWAEQAPYRPCTSSCFLCKDLLLLFTLLPSRCPYLTLGLASLELIFLKSSAGPTKPFPCGAEEVNFKHFPKKVTLITCAIVVPVQQIEAVTIASSRFHEAQPYA